MTYLLIPSLTFFFVGAKGWYLVKSVVESLNRILQFSHCIFSCKISVWVACLVVDSLYFFAELSTLFLHCFPNFIYMSLCSYRSPNFFKIIIRNSLSDGSQSSTTSGSITGGLLASFDGVKFT